MSQSFRKGDRVSLPVEATLRYVGQLGQRADVTLHLPDGEDRQVGNVDLKKAKRVKRQLVAGDTVEGVEAYKALPVGTLVKNHDWSSDGDLVRVKGGFIKLTDPRRVYDDYDFSDPRKILFVPEAS